MRPSFITSAPLSSCLVTNMSARGCSDGIKLCGGDAIVKSCSAIDCTASGIVFHGSTNKCTVSNAVVQDCFNGISCLEGSIVHVCSSVIRRCFGSGLTSRHNCSILLEKTDVEGAQEHLVALAEFCSMKILQCTLRGAMGAGVVVSHQSSCVLQDASVADCGGAGVESAGKLTMSSSTSSNNSSGVVLLQMTEAILTDCSFNDNNLAGVWSIGDSCDVRGCEFRGNRSCAYTAGADTIFVEDKCTLQANGSSASFLMWKTGKRSSAVQVYTPRGHLLGISCDAASRTPQTDIISAALSHATRPHLAGEWPLRSLRLFRMLPFEPLSF